MRTLLVARRRRERSWRLLLQQQLLLVLLLLSMLTTSLAQAAAMLDEGQQGSEGWRQRDCEARRVRVCVDACALLPSACTCCVHKLCNATSLDDAADHGLEREYGNDADHVPYASLSCSRVHKSVCPAAQGNNQTLRNTVDTSNCPNSPTKRSHFLISHT